VIVTHIDNPRAASVEELQQAGSRTGAEMVSEPNTAAALACAFELSPADGIVVVTGSIFLVGEAMKVLGIPA